MRPIRFPRCARTHSVKPYCPAPLMPPWHWGKVWPRRSESSPEPADASRQSFARFWLLSSNRGPRPIAFALLLQRHGLIRLFRVLRESREKGKHSKKPEQRIAHDGRRNQDQKPG